MLRPAWIVATDLILQQPTDFVYILRIFELWTQSVYLRYYQVSVAPVNTNAESTSPEGSYVYSASLNGYESSIAERTTCTRRRISTLIDYIEDVWHTSSQTLAVENLAVMSPPETLQVISLVHFMLSLRYKFSSAMSLIQSSLEHKQSADPEQHKTHDIVPSGKRRSSEKLLQKSWCIPAAKQCNTTNHDL